MKKTMATFLVLALGLPLGAQDKSDSKEAERLENCGTVIKEIMDIPMTFRRTLSTKRNALLFIHPS